MAYSAASTAAAAEARRRRNEEEEELTPYSESDLANDWEFKIVRSATNGFKNPETLKRVVDEEAQAGWVLVEKFDNQRLRFKRRRGAHPPHATTGIDPYRSYVGMSDNQLGLAVAGVVIGITLLVLLAVLLLADGF